MAQPAAEPGLSAVVQSIKVSGPLRAPSSCSCPTRVASPAQPCPPCSAGFSPLPQVSGYLNLLANTIDNFTHGLAVAASFLVSKKVSGGWGRWGPGNSSGSDGACVDQLALPLK